MKARPRRGGQDNFLQLTADSEVELFELAVVRHPGRPPLVGRPEIKTYIEVDEETIAGIDALRATPRISEAERALQASTGQLFDLQDLAGFMTERGFVKSLDGVEVPLAAYDERKKTYFGNVSSRSVQWLVSPATMAALIGLAGVAVVAGLLYPAARPSLQAGHQVLDPLGLMLVAFAVMLANAYLHELVHLFVARAHGVDAFIRFSRRFHILVLETDVSNAWLLPDKAKRISIFAAGTVFNVAAGSLAVVLAALLTAQAAQPGLVAALRFYAFLNILPIQFQMLLWLRTDLYFILLAWTEQRSLKEDAAAYRNYAFGRLLPRLLRLDEAACLACHQMNYRGAIRCRHCHGRLVSDPNKLDIDWPRRHFLMGYGLVALVAYPVAALFLLITVARAQEFILPLVVDGFSDALATGSLYDWAYATLAGAVAGLQLVLILVMFAGLGTGIRTAVLNRLRRNTHPAPALQGAGTA